MRIPTLVRLLLTSAVVVHPLMAQVRIEGAKPQVPLPWSSVFGTPARP
jgi:hypothetical protein